MPTGSSPSEGEASSPYQGTIYKLNPATKAFSVLHAFDSYNDGGAPVAGVIQGTDGNLYGTTPLGGASYRGTIYKLNPATKAFSVLHAFNDGGTPVAGVIQGTDRNLYGTTLQGGPGGGGVVYRLRMALGYGLSVSKAGAGTGTVTSSPSGINCGSDCTESYPSGKVVKLTAKARSDSVFAGWSGACSGTASLCQVTMTQAKTVTATFTKKTYQLRVSKAGSGKGTVTSNPSGINCGSDCTESYPSGKVIKLTAKPQSSSVFAGWSGACSGRSATCQVTLSKTRAVTATFNRRGAAGADELQQFLMPQENGGDADSATDLFLWENER